jgi:4-amino-4-deoxy-L-arabinose transferase-like glycosyltransferase
MKILEKYRFLIYLAAVIPLFIFRDFTPDNELRYLSIADEAIRNGNLFTFTNHGIPYADKPPLYLWIVMAGKLLFGHHSMFFLALFSYLPALIIVYVMDKWTKKYVNRQAVIAGELMLLTSVYFMGAGVVIRMDMLMCMFITLSLYVFYRMYTGEGKKYDGLLFPVLVFMAIFSKGPIGILVPLVSTITFLLLRRDYKAIGRFWGIKTLSVLLVLCLVWFGMVWAEGGKEYLNNLLFNQTVNRAVNSFHHKEPFYYYFISIIYSLFPWSILVITMIITGLSKRTKINEGNSSTLEKFFMVVAISTFAVLSVISSKLQIYLLPAFPFFIYLTLLWLQKFGTTGFGPAKFVKISLEIPVLFLILATPAYFIYILSSNRPEIYTVTLPASILIPVALLIISTAGILSLRILHSSNIQIYKVITTMGTGILLSIFVASFAMPQINPFIGMEALCKEAKEIAEKEGINNFVYYRLKQADNLDVFLGTQPQALSIEELKNIVDKRMSEEKEDPSRQIGSRSILFVKQSHMLEKDKEAATLLEKYEKHPVGKYFYIIL